jgi:hypothetical protein
VRYCLIPNGNPKAAPLIDPVFVDEWINVPGSPGAALYGLEPQIQSKLREYFEYQIWTRLNTLVPVAICAALALPHLPPEVSIAIRRVSIKDSAIEFQPTLGCIGTALSTFVPPVVPPLPGSS